MHFGSRIPHVKTINLKLLSKIVLNFFLKTWFESHFTFSNKVERGGVNNDGCLGTSLGLVGLS
jgi:hypothetical protein